jgi:uncharacterized MAPEG superfamily protein
MSELTCLELSVLLWLAHVVTQAVTARGEFGDAYLFSPRDKQLPTKGVACGRAARALANYIDNLVPFVALALALIVTERVGGAGTVGATIWILARVLYLPAYLMGITYVRTALWGIALVGLLMMLARLAGY